MKTNRHPGHRWHDTGWPLFAGLVSGIGAVAAAVVIGPVEAVVIFAGVALVAAPSIWSILSESGQSDLRSILHLTFAIALLAVVSTGWIAAFDGWGVVPLVVVAATSPALLARAVSRRRTASSSRGEEGADVEVRRVFDEIIRHSYSSRD